MGSRGIIISSLMGCKKKKKEFYHRLVPMNLDFYSFTFFNEFYINEYGLLNQFKLRFFPDRFRNISYPARARGTLDARGD